MSVIDAIFKWVWDDLGAEIIKEGGKWVKKSFEWQVAARKYEERVREDCGRLFVLGRPDPMPMDEIYTAVCVLEKVSAFKRYAPEQLQEMFIRRDLLHVEEEAHDGLNDVRTGENLFILGKPGAGKTTFLKHLAIKAVAGELYPDEEKARIPIFISLKAHADRGGTLLDSVEHELQVCRFPNALPFLRYLLRSGRALVLWDGLDEVSEESDKRGALVGEMRDFMREYRETQFVITCRVAASDYSFDNVRYLEMADFDDHQMGAFIHNWFDDVDLATRCWEELKKPDNKGLRELARIPLLLTLLTITYEETLTFPRRRVEIYEEAIDALLKKWDARRHIRRDEAYQHLSLGRKRQMLERIAAETFESGTFLLPRRKLAGMIVDYMGKVPGCEEQEIDGEVILRSIAAQHGIFVERTYNVYSFVHLSFQEYFTAKYIVQNAAGGTLDRLMQHVIDDQWREVFLLTASSLYDADELSELFAKHLSGMAERVSSIQTLLEWVDERAKRDAGLLSYRPVALRAWYLGLASACALDLACALDSVLDLNVDLMPYFAASSASVSGSALDSVTTLDSALNSVSTLARALDIEFASTLASANALASTRSSTLARVRASTHSVDASIRTRVRASTRARASASTLAHASACAGASIEYSGDRPYDVLCDRLDALTAPEAWASSDLWMTFGDRLQETIDWFRDVFSLDRLYHLDNEEKRMIESLHWASEEQYACSAYLKGTSLLVDCLELAYISDRRAVEDRLLLPANKTS